MKKVIVLVLASLFILTSCGWDDSTTEGDTTTDSSVESNGTAE